ncbi:FAD-dependent oxidoreductase [Pseudorhodoferax sp.]|uniref:FAD-dependent oxidoreductase n=1 Tax=Pseudorhodoferax sp. TaxID=1993553 RepID=UPI0039E3A047
MPESSREVDVVVLGCGAGGVATALGARRRGSEVLIVERQRPGKHTPSVRMSGGWLMTLTSAAEGAAYLSACAGGQVDEALFRPWAERNVHLQRWLEDIGVQLILADTETWGLSREEYGAQMWAEHPHLPGAQSVRVWRTATTLPPRLPSQGGMTGDTGLVQGGEAIYRGLMQAVQDHGIGLQWNARAQKLLVEHTAQGPCVRGVRIDTPEGPQEIRARRGVVLATGGFGGNPEYVRQFLQVPDTRFYGNPDNQGDGLRMAMSVGADLVRMTRMVGRGIISFDVPDQGQTGFLFVMSGGGYVICDQDGKRYADEYEQAQQQHTFYYRMQDFDPRRVGYTRSPSYWIFDERRRRAGPLPFTDRAAVAVGLYDWSADNQREIDAGWIGQGATPGAAAAAAGAQEDPARFDASVAAYNEACRQGKDAFGRPASTLVPLDSPPYYCVPLYLGGPYTHGGPRRDLQGRVISVEGRPIPGLFSAGEMGQAVGLMYPASGASIAEALCLGELAGESTMA